MPGFSFADYKTDPPLREQDVLLMICHDCDICCQEPEEEPTFECVPARRIAEQKSMVIYSRASLPAVYS